VERENLLGSAWKRLAQVETGDKVLHALRQSQQHYARAEALVLETGGDELFYPLMNGLAVQLRLAALQGQAKVEVDLARVAAARQSLQAKGTAAPDFWSVAAVPELQLLQALAQGRLAAERASIELGFDDLARRASAQHLWKSVYDQAVFVLQPHADQAKGAEGVAARALLKQLKALAKA
jgi:hypothetical protein